MRVLLMLAIGLGGIARAQDTAPVTHAAMSPDGRYTAYVEDGTLQIVDAETLETLPIFREVLGNVTAVDWHPDSRTIAVGTEDDLIYIWPVDGAEYLAGDELPGVVVLHHPTVVRETWDPAFVNSLDWNATGEFLASTVVFSDFQTYIWETNSYTPVMKIQTGDGSIARWSNNADILAIGTGGGLRLLDLANVSKFDQQEWSHLEWQAISRPVVEDAPDQRFGAVAWSSDDSQIAASTWFGDIWLIDTASGVGQHIGQVDQSQAQSSFFMVPYLEYDTSRQTIYVSVKSSEVEQSSRIEVWNLLTSELTASIDVPMRVFGFDYNESEGSLGLGFATLTTADLGIEE